MNEYRDKYPENPWDGSTYRKTDLRAKAVNVFAILRISIAFWSILILSFLIFSSIAKADPQATVTKETKSTKPKSETKVVLKGDVKEAAEEYAYILEQLLYLSSDYCRYFEKLDDKSSGENYKALANMCARITQEERYESVNKIMAEIDGLKKDLADRERELSLLQRELERSDSEKKEAHANQKALKLTTSLREELESLDKQLQREVVWRISSGKEYQEAITQYVKAMVNDSVMAKVHSIGMAYAPSVHVIHNEDGEDVVVVKVPDAQTYQYSYVTPTPQPGTPVPPIAPIPGHFEGTSFHKELSDSLLINSSDINIYVSNAFGDLEVSGWSQKKVSAVYTVAISADDEESCEPLNDKIDLRLYPKQNKVYIESIVPPLGDPKLKISRSRLRLTVPLDNKLFVTNSSGDILVDGIRSDVVVKGTNCNVELHDIEGDVEIINSSGSITVNNVRGGTNVQNRMGPVTLNSCNGVIDIGNSFGEISMSNSDGVAVIRNTGPVAVTEHIGNVEITNRSGPVEVTNLSGNLAAFNSFDLLKAQGIKGTAKLVNANAPVEINDVDGMVSVTNRFAPITVTSTSGPLYVENKSGDINLQLSTTMSGSSNIVATGGQINLLVAPRSNLFMNMESIGGQISVSGFDATVENGAAGVQSTKFKVGNGSNSLDVKANSSKVTVKPYPKLVQSTEF